MSWEKNPKIRNLPCPDEGRVETGVIRFGKDWPAIHIRGDEAIGLALTFKLLKKAVQETAPVSEGPVYQICLQLDRLVKLLESCDCKNLEQ